MSKKDFELIAKTIRELRFEGDDAARPFIAKAFAYALSNTNGRFDYQRFIAACE
jgi:hypothetical protein